MSFKDFLDFKDSFCYFEGKERNKIQDCKYHTCYLIHTFIQAYHAEVKSLAQTKKS